MKAQTLFGRWFARPPALGRWSSGWPSQAGTPGAAAALLLLAAGLLAGVATPAWQAQAQAAQRQADALARQRAQQQAAAVAVAAAEASASATAAPSARPAATLRVGELLTLARQHGVNVQRVAPQPARDAVTPNVTLTINAQGHYADLRRLIEAALRQDLALSLDDLSLRRNNANDALLEAEFHWTLWSMAPGGGEATAAARAPWPEPPRTARLAWGAPPPPPPQATPSLAVAVPSPPRFPYAWIGRLEEGSPPDRVTTALLAGPQRSVGVRAGDVLDTHWRIDRIAPTALQLTWLPTGQTLNLNLNTR